jgi:MtaA/CmuA family methyltransferase
MEGMQNVISALRHEAVDRPPFICPGGMMSMMTVEALRKLSAKWPQCHKEAGEMSRLARGVRDLTGIENLGVPYCMTVEAEAMGAGVGMGSLESEPRVVSYPLDKMETFESLFRLQEGKGRISQVIEAIEILHGPEPSRPLIANLTGPVSLATSLMEPMTFYKAMGKKTALTHEFLQFLTENLIILGKLMLRAGAQIVAVSDPSASGEILGPKRFRDYALPYINDILDALQGDSAASLVHICGNLTSIFHEVNELHTRAISIDSATSISSMRQSLDNDKIIIGNVSTHLLMTGTPDQVWQASLNCLNKGAAILAPACGISPSTPLANMQAMAEAARAYKPGIAE